MEELDEREWAVDCLEVARMELVRSKAQACQGKQLSTQWGIWDKWK